ncbi:MAG: DUF6259 domain-containing protein [Candidatus Helarchaeota archaeon]
MKAAWFALYHVYSTSKEYDEQGLANFEKDVKIAQDLGIDTLILEDYYSDFLWGEYINLWNEKTFRDMIQITKTYGIRFIPYLDLTELAVHGKIYQINGRKWSAKNRWGKPYAAFSSIFLPYYEYFDFHTKLMCPASGWGEYFLDQVRTLLLEFEVDGIYLDRADYRVICYDHLQDPNHFIQGIPYLIKKVRDEVKSVSTKNLLIMNDSCVDPDPPLVQCLETVDYVLTELLPLDTNPRSFYWQFLVRWGDLIYSFRHLLKPLFKLFMNLAFTTGSMTDATRIQEIINRLQPYVGKNILVFSHRKDRAGIRAIQAIAQKNQLACCYNVGLNYLRNVYDRFGYKS